MKTINYKAYNNIFPFIFIGDLEIRNGKSDLLI